MCEFEKAVGTDIIKRQWILIQEAQTNSEQFNIEGETQCVRILTSFLYVAADYIEKPSLTKSRNVAEKMALKKTIEPSTEDTDITMGGEPCEPSTAQHQSKVRYLCRLHQTQAAHNLENPSSLPPRTQT